MSVPGPRPESAAKRCAIPARALSVQTRQKSCSVAHDRDVPFARRDVLQMNHVAGMQSPHLSPSVAVMEKSPWATAKNWIAGVGW